MMTYKFYGSNGSEELEVSKLNDSCSIAIHNANMEIALEVFLSKESLYDLIGALHSIQSKIKREAL